jgi:mannose-1-phosphate guanylyltransferase
MNYAVIMAGGKGTRLWPMSRKAMPKQLQKLVTDKTLIQETFDRLQGTVNSDNVLVSTNPSYVDEIRKQLPSVKEENFIVEPATRNTAPALAYLAFMIFKRDPEAVIATLASDHVVNNNDVFSQTVKVAFKAVEEYDDHLIVVGINPTKPDTGLGYIKMGSPKKEIAGEQVFEVESFVEKPDLATAEKYVKSWEYLWNGAYYFFKAGQFLKWIEKYRPQLYKIMNEITDLQIAGGNGATQAKVKDLYNSLEDEQFENAIIEQEDFKKILVIPADLGWSDIGNWGTLHDVLSESLGSSMISRGYHIDSGSQDCLVYGGDKMIATLGLKDVIIIDTPDAVLIANKDKAQDIKKLLAKLKEEGKHIYL